MGSEHNLGFGSPNYDLGNIMALVQEDVKRMLAYSSMLPRRICNGSYRNRYNQIQLGSFPLLRTLPLYQLGAFTMLWVSRHKDKIHNARYDHPYEKFAGMIHIMPMGAVVMALFMLSLAGVPPFSVFWGKIYIMSSAVDVGMVWLAIVMGLRLGNFSILLPQTHSLYVP